MRRRPCHKDSQIQQAENACSNLQLYQTVTSNKSYSELSTPSQHFYRYGAGC